MSEQTGTTSGADAPKAATLVAAPPPMYGPPPHPGVVPTPQGQWPIRPGDPIPLGWMAVPGRPGYIQPRRYTPPPPGVLSTHWRGPARPAPVVVLSAVGFAGLLGAIALIPRPGVGWLAIGVALAAVGGLAARSARRAPADSETPADDSTAPPVETTATAVDPTSTAVGVTSAVDASEPEAGPGESAAVAAGPESDEPATVAAGPESGDSEPAEAVVTDPAPAATGTDAPAASTGGTGWLKKYGERTFWAAASLALLSVSVFRDAPWLIFWSFVGFLLCGAIALSGGRTVKGFAMSVVAAIAAPFAGIPWLSRGVQQAGKRRGGLRMFLVVVITIVLVVIFGALFAGADPEFNHLVTNILPKLSGVEVARAIFCFLLIAASAIGVGYLASARPTFDAITGRSARKVRRAEWVLPLVVLNLLFALFDVIQLSVLFNGDGALATKSKAYMKDYAHTGFWQLVWVTVLTLVVLALAFRLAPRADRSDRVWFRVLLGGLSVLSMVIVASALKRVASYEKLYGYTRLRVVVGGIELWVGFVFVLLFLAAMLIKANWLPRVIGGSLAVALFVGALINPDLYVAQHNVDRYLKTHKLSVAYMSQMSADAASAIVQLSGKNEICSAINIQSDELVEPEDWRSWNSSRAWAREQFQAAGLDGANFGICRGE